MLSIQSILSAVCLWTSSPKNSPSDVAFPPMPSQRDAVAAFLSNQWTTCNKPGKTSPWHQWDERCHANGWRLVAIRQARGEVQTQAFKQRPMGSRDCSWAKTLTRGANSHFHLASNEMLTGLQPRRPAPSPGWCTNIPEGRQCFSG